MADISTQDAVAEAYDRLSAEGGDDAAVDSATSDAGDTASDESVADAGSAGGRDDSAGQPSRVRDQHGRFAKGEPDAAARGNQAPRLTSAGAQEGEPGAPDGAAEPKEAAPAAPPASVLPELKPPQDWRAGAKEKWKLLPREVQEEAGRVYAETRKVLDENANLRKATEPLRQTFAQHEHVFRAAGAPVHQVIGGLLRSLSVLQTGHPQARADVVAGIARAYLGTDESALRLLAAALDAAPQAAAQAPPALTPQQIRDLVRQERQAGEAQSRQQGAVRLVDEFKASGAEYFDQVQPEMQAIATSWRARNPSGLVTKEVLKQWYDRACELNEETAPVIKQRKEAAAAKAKASTPAAAAAAGIKSEPTGPAGQGKTKSTFDEVARQYDRLSRPARV